MTSAWLIIIIILSSIQSCLHSHPAFLEEKNQQHAPFSIDHITTPFWIAIGCHSVTQPKPLKLIDEKKANWKLRERQAQFSLSLCHSVTMLGKQRATCTAIKGASGILLALSSLIFQNLSTFTHLFEGGICKICLEGVSPGYFMEIQIDKLLQDMETDDLIKVASQLLWYIMFKDSALYLLC